MNILEYEKLSKGEKFIVDWRHTNTLSDFKTALIKLITQADPNNKVKIRLGFPDEVDAYINYHTVHGWWQSLCNKLEIEY